MADAIDDGPRVPKRLIVVKVPLNYVPEAQEADFGRIKPPYLELLENKARVKDALRDQDYDPDLLLYPNPPLHEGPSGKVKSTATTTSRSSSTGRLVTTSDVSRRLHVPRAVASEDDRSGEEEEEEARSGDDDDDRSGDERSERSGDDRSGDERSERSGDDRSGDERSDRSADDRDQYHRRVHNSYRDEYIQQDRERRARERRERDERGYHSTESDDSSKPASNQWSRYLMEGGDRSTLAPKLSRDRRDRDRDRDRPDRPDRGGDRSGHQHQGPTSNLPSLSQIQDGRHHQGGSNKERRFEQEATKEQTAERDRSNLLMKLYRLKMAFPDGDIPPYSETTDTDTLRKIFEQTRRKLHVNKDTEQYKQWSAMAHMALEYILVNLVKMKTARGLAEHHMRSAEKYNELLMELSDQQYNSGPSSWPVHWRLAGLVAFETAVFIGGNVLMNKLAGNMGAMFSNMGSGSKGTSSSSGVGSGAGIPMAPPPPVSTHNPGMSSATSTAAPPNLGSPFSSFTVHGPGQSGANPSSLTMDPPPIAFGTQPPVSKMSGPKLDLNPDKRKSD
jgi:hypothetical protein